MVYLLDLHMHASCMSQSVRLNTRTGGDTEITTRKSFFFVTLEKIKIKSLIYLSLKPLPDLHLS